MGNTRVYSAPAAGIRPRRLFGPPLIVKGEGEKQPNHSKCCHHNSRSPKTHLSHSFYSYDPVERVQRRLALLSVDRDESPVLQTTVQGRTSASRSCSGILTSASSEGLMPVQTASVTPDGVCCVESCVHLGRAPNHDTHRIPRPARQNQKAQGMSLLPS